MELCLHLDGKENLYLRVPTVWDAVYKKWIGFIKTPQTDTLIYGHGKTYLELLNSFNVNANKLIHESPELEKEIFSMFMPSFYWES